MDYWARIQFKARLILKLQVDFDRTKHLAESTIKRRAQEREKLAQKEREIEETERRKKELQELKRSEELWVHRPIWSSDQRFLKQGFFFVNISRRMEKEEREEAERKAALKSVKEKRRMEREERRRQRKLEQKLQYNEEEVAEKIALEERKLLIAQRKLESIRLLDELLDRVKVIFTSPTWLDFSKPPLWCRLAGLAWDFDWDHDHRDDQKCPNEDCGLHQGRFFAFLSNWQHSKS